jgi:hypothetical protein
MIISAAASTKEERGDGEAPEQGGGYEHLRCACRRRMDKFRREATVQADLDALGPGNSRKQAKNPQLVLVVKTLEGVGFKVLASLFTAVPLANAAGNWGASEQIQARGDKPINSRH